MCRNLKLRARKNYKEVTAINKLSLFILLFLSLLLGNAPVYAKEVRILVLLSLDVTYPYVKSKVDGLAFEGARNPITILLDIQSVEDERFTNPQKLDQYYRSKAEQLKNSKPDIIVVSGSPVIFSFYNDYIFPIMPDVPMVGETRSIPSDFKPEAYSFIKYQQNMAKTVDIALSLSQPKTVYLIGDATHPGSTLSMDLVENSLSEKTNSKVERLDMPFDELVETVKHLPKNSVGFFNLIFSDGKGKRLIPEDVLQKIADQAPFPIFAFHETMLGSGATGGVVAKGEDVGIQMVRESMLAFYSAPFNPPRIVPAISTTLFDWKYMQKFGIELDSLPQGAEVINMEPDLLDHYFYQIVGIVLIIVIQGITTALLIRYSSQKKKLTIELSTINKELEQRVGKRTHKLVELNKDLKRKEEEITHLMFTDVLTGIPNRRYFEKEITREFARSERYESDLCLAICDIDNFKQVNDFYGHHVGDAVLIGIAESIRHTVRNSDFVARWGGEEFVIQFIDSDRHTAESISERVRLAVSEINFDMIGEPVTISIGIAQRQPKDSLSDVMKHADIALYRSKDEGRNCTSFYNVAV